MVMFQWSKNVKMGQDNISSLLILFLNFLYLLEPSREDKPDV